MLFQAIDDKNECVGVYADGKLDFENIPENLTKTWKYSGSLSDENIEYAWLYAGGKNLQDCCPMELVEDLTSAQKKMNAYKKSFEIAKINLREHCVFDLIPHDFLLQFCEIKNKITNHVFESYKKPANYDHLDSVQKLLHKIRYQTLNINVADCKHLLTSTIHRNKIQQIKNNNYINYDLFVALDYNGAEVRTLLELQGVEQPSEDIHEWNCKHLFEQDISREECKVRFFAWLYDPDSNDIKTDCYDRESLLTKWYDGENISTPYGRVIPVERRKAFNYLIQSTTADRVLEKAVKIDKLLEGHESYVSHIIHDEIVLDYCDEDRNLIPLIRELFEDGFMSSVSAGKDGYNLKELAL